METNIKLTGCKRKGIVDALATADKVKADMQQLKSENEALLNKAKEERALMLKDAKIQLIK